MFVEFVFTMVAYREKYAAEGVPMRMYSDESIERWELDGSANGVAIVLEWTVCRDSMRTKNIFITGDCPTLFFTPSASVPASGDF